MSECTHSLHYKKAKDAICELYADGSIPTKTALDSLQTLRDELDTMIEALESDIRQNVGGVGGT